MSRWADQLLEVVVTEAVGYELAARIGLEVPPWAFCRMGGDDEVYFASKAMRMRTGLDVLLNTPLVVNEAFLRTCIAFDVWTANRDRNAGNVIKQFAGREIRLVGVLQPSAPNATPDTKALREYIMETWSRDAVVIDGNVCDVETELRNIASWVMAA